MNNTYDYLKTEGIILDTVGNDTNRVFLVQENDSYKVKIAKLDGGIEIIELGSNQTYMFANNAFKKTVLHLIFS